MLRHDWAQIVNAGQDLGLDTRFAAACRAQHERVLIQDDDLELPVDLLRTLLAAWEHDPEILHGVFGRAPKPDGSYARNIGGNADAPVVLTRVLLAIAAMRRGFSRPHPPSLSSSATGFHPATARTSWSDSSGR